MSSEIKMDGEVTPINIYLNEDGEFCIRTFVYPFDDDQIVSIHNDYNVDCEEINEWIIYEDCN